MLSLRPHLLQARLATMPFVKALIPFAAGVVMAMHYLVPWWLLIGVIVLMGILALKTERLLPQLLLFAAFGGLIASGRTDATLPPLSEAALYLIDVENDSAPRERGSAAEGHLIAWCNPNEGDWYAIDGFVQLRCDSLLSVSSGERLLFRGRIYPYRYGSPSFLRLMHNRGYWGSCYLNETNLLLREESPYGSLHRTASHALKRRFEEQSSASAVVRAMTIGDRSGIDPTLRNAYARSGMSHLLAVSGLHTGIIFTFINLLLIWLPLIRRGEVVRNLLAVALIWIYVIAAGAPPSAVRAAVMCSILQFALLGSSSYYAMNAWAAAAMAMLIWNPRWIGEIGFQLSFVAVAAILLWGVPLCRLLRTRWGILNIVIHSLIIGFSASLSTAPLTAYAFGIVPLLGLALNPVVVLLGMVVVGCGLLILLIPPMSGWISPVALGAARGLNELATRIAAHEEASVDLHLSGSSVCGIYLLFVAITLLMWCIERKKSVHL